MPMALFLLIIGRLNRITPLLPYDSPNLQIISERPGSVIYTYG